MMKITTDNTIRRSFHSSNSYINLTSVIVIYITCSSFFLLYAKSETYIVGDENLWTDSIAYNTWSQKYNFTVGDILEFKYTIQRHNVYEVTEKAYRSCNFDQGYTAKYVSGDDRIQLKEARSYWFLCGIDGHCLGGQRFGIKVLNGSSMDLPAAALSPQQMNQPNSSTTTDSHSSSATAFSLDCRIAGFLLQGCILGLTVVVL